MTSIHIFNTTCQTKPEIQVFFIFSATRNTSAKKARIFFVLSPSLVFLAITLNLVKKSFKMSSSKTPEVHIPMIVKMERICRGYIDQLEKGGKHFNIQNFMMMYIFGSTNNTEYRTKLFDHWPTVSCCFQVVLYFIVFKLLWPYLTVKFVVIVEFTTIYNI